jgi:hypothetical protein
MTEWTEHELIDRCFEEWGTEGNYLWLFKIWPLCALDGKVHAASPLWCRWWRSRS